MKRIIIALGLYLNGTVFALSQNFIPIPDTLSGNNINLEMHADSIDLFVGEKTRTLAFNNYKFLGPTLILKKGEIVNIHVKNLTDDTTTLHWHGLHVAPAVDGGPHVIILPDSTWKPKFTVLDNASTYWYHPHFHRKTAEQTIKGALGFIIVRDTLESNILLPRRYGIDDIPLIVQSVQLDLNNQFMPYGMQDSILLVNGLRANYGHEAVLNVPAQVVRFRLLNASGERTFNFGFSGNKSFIIIGSDGGLLSAPVNANRIRISPGERYEILVDFSQQNGQNIFLMSYASELPMGVQGGPTMPMPPGSLPMHSPLNGTDFNILKIHVINPTANPVLTFPSVLTQVNPIPASQANYTRQIVMSAEDPMSMDGPFYLNNQIFDMDRIDFYIPINNIEIWELSNNTMVAHPFHIHGVQFFVLDRDGNLPPTYEQGRKDVVMVLPNETVRIISKFETFSDTMVPYPYHCHILMHEDDGMMGQFIVMPSPVNGIPFYDYDYKSVHVFPNPTTDYLRFDIKKAPNLIYKIFNSTGHLVLQGTTSDASIAIYSLPRGVYYIWFLVRDEIYSARFHKL